MVYACRRSDNIQLIMLLPILIINCASLAQGNKRAMNRLTELKRMGNKRGLAVRPTRQQAKDECVIS